MRVMSAIIGIRAGFLRLLWCERAARWAASARCITAPEKPVRYSEFTEYLRAR